MQLDKSRYPSTLNLSAADSSWVLLQPKMLDISPGKKKLGFNILGFSD